MSDVDGHSQCMMRVSVEDGAVTEIRGDPLDPEGTGELTFRGKHIKNICLGIPQVNVLTTVVSARVPLASVTTSVMLWTPST